MGIPQNEDCKTCKQFDKRNSSSFDRYEEHKQVSVFYSLISFFKSQHYFVRHPFVFCLNCGKLGRKDWMKKTHFKDHPYTPLHKCGFVRHGQEPNHDKHQDFEKFLKHFDLPPMDENDQQNHTEVVKTQKLQCQGYFWGTGKMESDHVTSECQKEPTNIIDEMIENQSKAANQRPKNDKQGKQATKNAKDINADSNQKLEENMKSEKIGTFSKKVQRGIKSLSIRNQGQKKKVSRQQLKTLMIKKSKQAKKPVKCFLKKTGRMYSDSKKKLVDSKKKVTIKIQSKGCKKSKSKNRFTCSSDKSKLTDIWKVLILKKQMTDLKKNMKVVLDHQKAKIVKMIKDNRKEFLDLNEDHKQLMLRERDKHCHLYNQSAEFDSTKQQLEESQKCIKDQREDIILMLGRLAKFRPSEVKDYPKNLMNDGEYDPLIWKLTKEPEIDHESIADLKSKLKISTHHEMKLQKEVHDLKQQLNYASNHIQMLSQTNIDVIHNVLMNQNQAFVKNFNYMQQQCCAAPKNTFESTFPTFNCKQELNKNERSIFQNEMQSNDEEPSEQDSKKKVSFCSIGEVLGTKEIDVQTVRDPKRVWKIDQNLQEDTSKEVIKDDQSQEQPLEKIDEKMEKDVQIQSQILDQYKDNVPGKFTKKFQPPVSRALSSNNSESSQIVHQ